MVSGGGNTVALLGPLTTHHSTTHQQDVRGLQVAVNDPLLVGRVHGPGHRLDQVRRRAGGQGNAPELLLQIAAVVITFAFWRDARRSDPLLEAGV